MNLPILSTAAKTMSSRDLLELINTARLDAGENPIRANDFNNRVADELDDQHYETFVVTNANGTSSKVFELTVEQCMLVSMRESKAVRRTVLSVLKQAAAPVAPKPVITLPDFTDPAAAAIAWAAEYQAKQAAMLERDEAIRTKAQIGSRREATAMATAAKATREAAKMAELVGRAVNHACVLAVQAATGAKYAWPPLKAHCVANNLPILRVHSEAYGEVNSYPASAWLEVYGVDLSQLWGVAA